MGIQINGNTNNINAGIGSLSIEDLKELDIIGVATASNFKTGVSNLHNVGLTLSGGQIDVGSNIKIGTAGIITATELDISGDIDVDGHTNLDNVSIAGISTFSGNVNITNTNPKLFFYDTNNDSDYAIVNNGGVFRINDETNSLNRFSIDSAGLVMIGTTTEGNVNADDLTIANSGEGGITIRSGSSSNGNIFFSDATSGAGEYAGFIDYKHSSNVMTFGTSSVERVRIDNSGKVAMNYDAGVINAQYGNLEILKDGASNVDPNWSYLSFHRTGQIAWQQGINANDFVIASGGGAARDTLQTEKLRITTDGAISQTALLTGNTALAFLRNTRTRASGNKYGIEFRDNINEANANIVIQQNSSGNNAAHMSFYISGGTGGNGLENGNHLLRLKQAGDVEIPTGGIEFRSLGSSPAQAAPAFINMGGTHSNAAGNGTNLNAKLKVWSDGTDMMGLSVSSNQLDYILTQEVYDHVWYGGNSGTSELMRLEGDGDLILTNGNKLNINKSNAAGQGGALLNIGWDQGTNIATKAIDIGGGWSAGENKRITFSHSTGSNNLVGEINSIHYGGTGTRTNPHSGLRFGKLYHNNDSTTFTMSLDSTSTTTADLNLRGAYRSSHHPAFCVSGSAPSNFSTLAKMQYTTHGTHGVNQDGFDNSNDRFVAPVDGVYHFYVRHWYQQNTANSTVWLYFYRNGSQIKEVRTAYGSSAPGEYVTVQLSTTVFLSATNYIEVYGQSTNNALHPSSGSFHTEFSGFMVC